MEETSEEKIPFLLLMHKGGEDWRRNYLPLNSRHSPTHPLLNVLLPSCHADKSTR